MKKRKLEKTAFRRIFKKIGVIGLSSKISMPSVGQKLVHFAILSQKSCQGRDGPKISWKTCPAKLESVLKPLLDTDCRSVFLV